LHTRIRSSAALSRWVFSVPLSPRSTTGFPSAEVVAVGQGGQLGGLDSHDRIDVELRKSFEARESRSGDAAGAATLGPVVDLSGQQLGDRPSQLQISAYTPSRALPLLAVPDARVSRSVSDGRRQEASGRTGRTAIGHRRVLA
jgi:hypothetical protein